MIVLAGGITVSASVIGVLVSAVVSAIVLVLMLTGIVPVLRDWVRFADICHVSVRTGMLGCWIVAYSWNCLTNK